MVGEVVKEEGVRGGGRDGGGELMKEQVHQRKVGWWEGWEGW